MRYDDTDLKLLLEDIDRYFDCSLSDEQERLLRRRLAATRHVHPAIDEARMLMGFYRQERRHSPYFRGRMIAAVAGIAAAVAVVFALGWKMHKGQPDPMAGDVCLAYSGGQIITDEDAVIAIVAETMSEVHNGVFTANSDLRDDVSIIAPAIDRYVTNFDPINVLL